MRTPLWETSGGALMALLNQRKPLNIADLYTVTSINGTVYRWSGSDVQLTGNSQTWTLGPGLRRSKVRFTVGVTVDSLSLFITNNKALTINGIDLMAYIRDGGFNGARVQVDRAFWGIGQTQPVGAFYWFGGRVSEIPLLTRFEAQLEIKNDTELLNVMVPRDLAQASCPNTLFDSACGLAKPLFAQAGTTSGALSADRTTFTATALAQAVGYYDLGTVQMTSGPNNGFIRTVKKYTKSPDTFVVMPPWPYAQTPGQTFTAYPGCDKTQATCTSKFSNLARFRGMPYIPIPETVL